MPHNPNADILEDTDIDVSRPSKWKVILVNDNYTPMDFVVWVLENIFNKSYAEAAKLTMEVHEKGRGIAGVYSKELAKTKVLETTRTAQKNNHPLKVIMEKE